MTRFRWLSVAAAAVLVLAVVPACKTKAPQTVPTSASAAAPAPAVAVAPGSASAGTDVGRGDVLSEDVAALNRRGYLKDAFFDYDQASLRPDAREALSADAGWLKKYPSTKILIEGHCDERGTEEYNLALGDRRAAAVREYLASLGVNGARVSTVSYGKERPFCSQENESCYQENRRGHMLITAK
jgi:peptidoglycan-associated lipoprotein